MTSTTRSSQTRRSFIASAAASTLAAACAQYPPARPPRFDVLIIGAGLAGLIAGRLLSKAGLTIKILEARDRPGGRVFTGYDLPDRPEYGGIQVGGAYERFRRTAAELNVEIAPYAHSKPFQGSVLDINGQVLDARSWETAPANSLSPDEKNISPWALSQRYLRDGNPFTGATDWQLQTFQPKDRSIHTALKEAGASEEAIRLIEHTANNNSISETSVFNEWRSQFLFRASPISEVVTNGSSAMPEAMAAALSTPPEFNAAVASLTTSKVGVAVTTQDGRRFEADFCINTMPLPAYSQIQTNLALSDLFTDGITGGHYTKITLLFVDTDPFWLEDGLPIMMWSDGPLERFFPRVSPKGEVVGYKIWVNGKGADIIDRMPQHEVSNLVATELNRIRPASEGKVKLAKIHSWQKERFTGGAYMQWPAGKSAGLSEAVRTPIGRVHFAGEHASIEKTGLEGALESGERAAQEILQQVM